MIVLVAVSRINIFEKRCIVIEFPVGIHVRPKAIITILNVQRFKEVCERYGV